MSIDDDLAARLDRRFTSFSAASRINRVLSKSSGPTWKSNSPGLALVRAEGNVGQQFEGLLREANRRMHNPVNPIGPTGIAATTATAHVEDEPWPLILTGT